MTLDLPLIWAGIIAFGVIMYVVMDGFDLGVGILFPFAADEDERDTMMNTVAPIWDGNETWLVLGGAGLFGAFPLAYAVVLPALYLPLLVMLVALIFRGVAFEFRFKTTRGKRLWGLSFQVGSTLAAFAQGVVLGAYVRGIAVEEQAFSGGAFDWLSAFSLFTGAALVCGYAALGAGWLILKTEGALQERAYGWMRGLTGLVVAAIAAASLWTPLMDEGIAARWFTWPNIAWLSPVPILVAVLAVLLMRAVAKRQERRPFLLTLGLFLLSYAGLAISLWPTAIPPGVTIWEAAAPPESQGFLLVGFAILIPIILTYTGYTYWVFRGKVRGGYH